MALLRLNYSHYHAWMIRSISRFMYARISDNPRTETADKWMAIPVDRPRPDAYFSILLSISGLRVECTSAVRTAPNEMDRTKATIQTSV